MPGRPPRIEMTTPRLRWMLWPLVACMAPAAIPQTAEIHGQASASASGKPGAPAAAQGILRYIPDLLVEDRLTDALGAGMELSVNAFADARYQENQEPSYDRNIILYRGWFRITTDRFEARIGLQKITFGSALLFRPLMWFDRIDPRDPLQLTNGVYGAMAKYTLQDNVNFWIWGLYGNDGTKGWEIAPTESKSVEYGGRAQSPLWSGEIGVTYHHRRTDMSGPLHGSAVPEDRIGLDGKWDLGIGLWFEGTLVRDLTPVPGLKYQRLWTIGADYTFNVGSGLYVATEYFRSENPLEPFAGTDGPAYSGLSVNYPLGILDQASAIVYRDWKSHAWYRILTFQRKYDDWTIYALGFWDPATVSIPGGQGGAGAFAGTGVQLILAYNH